jgi:hypothetical protein
MRNSTTADVNEGRKTGQGIGGIAVQRAVRHALPTAPGSLQRDGPENPGDAGNDRFFSRLRTQSSAASTLHRFTGTPGVWLDFTSRQSALNASAAGLVGA